MFRGREREKTHSAGLLAFLFFPFIACDFARNVEKDHPIQRVDRECAFIASLFLYIHDEFSLEACYCAHPKTALVNTLYQINGENLIVKCYPRQPKKENLIT